MWEGQPVEKNEVSYQFRNVLMCNNKHYLVQQPYQWPLSIIYIFLDAGA